MSPCWCSERRAATAFRRRSRRRSCSIVDFGLPLQDAIEAPRARLWDGRQVEPETRIPAATLEALRKRGHDIMQAEDWTMRVGGMQGIAIDRETGALTGACDPRRDGYVATP